jgi:hypothetical protein
MPHRDLKYLNSRIAHVTGRIGNINRAIQNGEQPAGAADAAARELNVLMLERAILRRLPIDEAERKRLANLILNSDGESQAAAETACKPFKRQSDVTT